MSAQEAAVSTIQLLIPTWIAVLIAVCLAIACYAYGKAYLTPVDSDEMPLPPAAKGIPFIGDTFEYIRDGPSCGQKHHDQHGSIYRSWLLGERIIHVGDADACKLLMTCEHDLVEGEWPYTIAKLMGKQALCNAHGKRHFQLRKAMGPAFSAEAVVAYIPRMVQIAETLCENWADSKQVKGKMIFKDFTFQVTTELVLGLPEDIITPELLARQQGLFETFLEGFVALPFNFPGTALYKALHAQKVLKAEYKQNILRLWQGLDSPMQGKPMACLQMLMKASRESPKDLPIDMEFLQANCFNLLLSAHDFSAATLCMILRHIKKEPEALCQLRAEQAQVIRERGAKLNQDTLQIMPYADAVMKEALRLGAVINIVPKRALKTFEIGGYTIPKGYRVQLEIWKILLDDCRWVNMEGTPLAPSKFNPSRWLNKEGRSSQLGSFVPFSAGPRMCIGYSFALQEIKIMLAVLARGYDWSLDLDEPIKTFPIPYPRNGMPMTFTKRVPSTLHRSPSFQGNPSFQGTSSFKESMPTQATSSIRPPTTEKASHSLRMSTPVTAFSTFQTPSKLKKSASAGAGTSVKAHF